MKKFLILFVALVIAATMTVSPAFAEGKTTNDTIAMTVSATVTSGTTINVTWNAVSGASSYDVEVRRNNSVVSQRRGITGTSVSISVNGYGDHVVNVIAKTSTGGIAGSGSTTVNVPYSSTNGGITVSSSGSDTIVSWASSATVSSYYVSWTGQESGNGTATNSGTTCSYTISGVSYDKISSVTVREGNSSGAIVGVWTASYSGGATTTGGVYISGTTLYWTAVPGHYYSVTASGNYGSQTVLASSTTEHVDFSGLVTNNTTITFTVRDTTTGITVGTATYYPIGSSTGTVTKFNIIVNETSVTATWLRDPYATNYRVTYKGLAESSTASYFETAVTTAAFSRPAGGFNIEVGFYYNNRYYPIGAATVSESGEVTYSESGHIESCGKDAYVHWTKCDVCGESWGVEEHVLGEDGVCEICRFKPEQESTGSGIRGDLNSDGNVNVTDGVTMQRILAGLE